MELLFLTCLQAQFVIGRVNSHPKLTSEIRSELISEIKEVTKKGCFVNAKVD